MLLKHILSFHKLCIESEYDLKMKNGYCSMNLERGHTTDKTFGVVHVWKWGLSLIGWL